MKQHAALLVVLAVFGVGAAEARDRVGPAELPPADYAGQQYVDSEGCMFVRAGTEREVLWIPRVTREGKRICGSPPSGRRVPVAEEVGVAPVPSDGSAAETAGAATTEAPAAAQGEAAAGGFFVAVGSFGAAANVTRAEAKLAKLGYGVVRGRVSGGSKSLTTVFAGPFDSAEAAVKARRDLRGRGFPDAVVIGP
ncbi:SPOR domain-containing protein [Tabrizicola sp.]|uniref:SPOR domain-containing protein n=1 Tax=Tabrizicola sp. TaxID=2005166 RepID=UPI003F37143F